MIMRAALFVARLLKRWCYEDVCPYCGARLSSLELDADAPWCWRCNGAA